MPRDVATRVFGDRFQGTGLRADCYRQGQRHLERAFSTVRSNTFSAYLLFAAGIASLSVLLATSAAAQQTRGSEVTVGAGTTDATTTGSSGPQKQQMGNPDTAGRAAGSGSTDVAPRASTAGGLRCDLIQDQTARRRCEQTGK
jgi:hypothetical protein